MKYNLPTVISVCELIQKILQDHDIKSVTRLHRPRLPIQTNTNAYCKLLSKMEEDKHYVINDFCTSYYESNTNATIRYSKYFFISPKFRIIEPIFIKKNDIIYIHINDNQKCTLSKSCVNKQGAKIINNNGKGMTFKKILNDISPNDIYINNDLKFIPLMFIFRCSDMFLMMTQNWLQRNKCNALAL